MKEEPGPNSHPLDFRYALADKLRDLHRRRPEAIEAANEIVSFFLSSGYAKRGDVVEECAREAEAQLAHQDTATPVNSVWWENAGVGKAVKAIRALKEPE